MRKIRRLLVANRSEITIRVFRAAAELGIGTIAIYAEEDKLSLHRFKADEAYQLGPGKGALAAYLSIEDVIQVAKARLTQSTPDMVFFPRARNSPKPARRRASLF